MESSIETPAQEQTAPETPEQQEQQTPPILTDEQEKHRQRTIRLLEAGSSKHKGGFAPKDFKEFLEAQATMAGVSKAQLERYAKGEDRTPKALGDKVAQALAESNTVPERGKRWARGMAAVAATNPGGLPPAPEPEPEPEPDTPAEGDTPEGETPEGDSPKDES